MTQNVIVLYPERIRQLQHDEEVSMERFRLERRFQKIITSVEAFTTVLIGFGFLACIGLTITML